MQIPSRISPTFPVSLPLLLLALSVLASAAPAPMPSPPATANTKITAHAAQVGTHHVPASGTAHSSIGVGAAVANAVQHQQQLQQQTHQQHADDTSTSGIHAVDAVPDSPYLDEVDSTVGSGGLQTCLEPECQLPNGTCGVLDQSTLECVPNELGDLGNAASAFGGAGAGSEAGSGFEDSGPGGNVYQSDDLSGGNGLGGVEGSTFGNHEFGGSGAEDSFGGVGGSALNPLHGAGTAINGVHGGSGATLGKDELTDMIHQSPVDPDTGLPIDTATLDTTTGMHAVPGHAQAGHVAGHPALAGHKPSTASHISGTGNVANPNAHANKITPTPTTQGKGDTKIPGSYPNQKR